MRLDKFLCDMNIGTRSEVKEYIKKGRVRVNSEIIKKADSKVNESSDNIYFDGFLLSFSKYQYYMFHKPKDCVTATSDNVHETVMDYLKDAAGKNLFPVGRLDKDTEGLLLVTNDGELSHRLLSPKNHVPKTYLVQIRTPLQAKDIARLETGVDILDDTLTKPAKVKVITDNLIELTIVEGRFHQIKRMLHSVGNEVVYLKRLSMGSLILDEKLALGQFRSLTDEEINQLSMSNIREIL